MNDNLKLEELTKEQILDLADTEGKKLGFLLAASPFDEETKKAILTIVEKANFEQIEAISNFLEDGYLMAQNKELNDWFKAQLENIKREADKKQEELDNETLSKIEELEGKLQ